MLRGFRHTLFLLLQLGVLVSGGAAVAIWPDAWRAVLLCVAGSVVASWVCERIARRYLRHSLGTLRRAADAVSRGHPPDLLPAQPGDDFYKLVGAINQITNRLAELVREHQRLEDELRRRERLAFLGQLAASVAHEVNNPLDGVQNCLRILRRSADNPERTAQMIDLIDNGLTRIELIVRRLLALAREDAIRPEHCEIREILDGAVEAVKPRLTAAGVAAERAYADCHAAIRADPLLLQQVFTNLLINAADSMPDGGRVTISARIEQAPPLSDTDRRNGALVRVEVRDHGTGIASDVLPHIFEPFYTTKSDGRGTGLGLPIAARIVQAHRGTIDAHPGDDGGTTFIVRIPCPQAQA